MATRHTHDRPWFERADDLLTALTVCTPDRDTLPNELLYDQGLGWAPAQDLFQPWDQFEKLMRQHDWKVKRRPVPDRVQRISTADLLGAVAWDYCDPVGTRFRGGADRPPMMDGEWAFLDRGERRLQFLLAARGRAGAARILEALSAFQADGIQAAPLLPESAAQAACPFDFFWQLTLERPHPLVFDAADRVWWGPVGYGQVAVFFEYPYRPRMPETLPHRIQWSHHPGVVLLGPQPPQVVELGLAPGGRRFGSYLGMVELCAPPTVSRPLLAVQATVRPTFEVELRLGQQSAQAKARQRILGLRREIAAKQRLLAHLAAAGAGSEPDDLIPEPLFLFYQGPAERDEIPEPLRRLLIEWSDQPQTLGTLAYALLAGDTLPAELFDPDSRVHVLTTFAGLGRDHGRSDTAATLLDYAPYSAGSRHLDLSRTWTAQGLRLFTPAAEHVTLYPNLRPTPHAAERVANAVLAGLESRPARPVYLLLPGLGRLPQFVVLDAADFRPFADAFNWVLDLECQAVLVPRVEAFEQRLLPALTTAIDNDLTAAAQREATERIGSTVDRLSTQLQQLQDQVEQRDKRVQDAQARAQALDRLAKGTERRLFADLEYRISARVRDAAAALLRDVTRLETDLNARAGRVKSAQLLNAQLERLAAASQRRLFDGLQRRIIARVRGATKQLLGEVKTLEIELAERDRRLTEARTRAGQLTEVLGEVLADADRLIAQVGDAGRLLGTVLKDLTGPDPETSLTRLEQLVVEYRTLSERLDRVKSRLSEIQPADGTP